MPTAIDSFSYTGKLGTVLTPYVFVVSAENKLDEERNEPTETQHSENLVPPQVPGSSHDAGTPVEANMSQSLLPQSGVWVIKHTCRKLSLMVVIMTQCS